jgi:hypothetical protein
VFLCNTYVRTKAVTITFGMKFEAYRPPRPVTGIDLLFYEI